MSSGRQGSDLDAAPEPTLPRALPVFYAAEFQITRFLGAMGVMEVTDWQYYDVDLLDGREKGRRRVRPSPFDPNMPTRTTRSLNPTAPGGSRDNGGAPTLTAPPVPSFGGTWRVGDAVEARFLGLENPGRYFPGTVRAVYPDGTYGVAYEDGDYEDGVEARFIRPRLGSGGGVARPPGGGGGSEEEEAAGTEDPQRRSFPSPESAQSRGDAGETPKDSGGGSARPERGGSGGGFSVRFFEGVSEEGRRVVLKEFAPSAAQAAVTEATAIAALRQRWLEQRMGRGLVPKLGAGGPTKRGGGGGGSSGGGRSMGSAEGGASASDYGAGLEAEEDAEAAVWGSAAELGLGDEEARRVERLLDEEAPFVGLKGGIAGNDAFGRRDFIKGWRRTFPEVAPPQPRNLWLVFKWEGFGNTAGAWPRQTQEWQAMDAIMPRLRLDRRGRFTAATAKAALEALAFVHEAGYAHRSLGPSSLLLSTADDRARPELLRVKLTDFGFATPLAAAAADPGLRRRAAAAGQAGSPFALTAFVTGEDLFALGLVLLELHFSALAAVDPGPSPRRAPNTNAPPSDGATFQRLFCDLFDGDVRRLRDFCAEEPAWGGAVALLDKRRGGERVWGRSGAAGGGGGGEGKGGSNGPAGKSTDAEVPLGDGWTLFGLLLSARGDFPRSPVLASPSFMDPDARLLTARALLESPYLEF